mmetsp:Transcript_41625/g.97863  ORF Transcript_41625/g.97863 Transcript_41625/m.97863 type:complete len:383 (+) Transcript_41625:267-1415(+)
MSRRATAGTALSANSAGWTRSPPMPSWPNATRPRACVRRSTSRPAARQASMRPSWPPCSKPADVATPRQPAAQRHRADLGLGLRGPKPCDGRHGPDALHRPALSDRLGRRAAAGRAGVAAARPRRPATESARRLAYRRPGLPDDLGCRAAADRHPVHQRHQRRLPDRGVCAAGAGAGLGAAGPGGALVGVAGGHRLPGGGVSAVRRPRTQHRCGRPVGAGLGRALGPACADGRPLGRPHGRTLSGRERPVRRLRPAVAAGRRRHRASATGPRRHGGLAHPLHRRDVGRHRLHRPGGGAAPRPCGRRGHHPVVRDPVRGGLRLLAARRAPEQRRPDRLRPDARLRAAGAVDASGGNPEAAANSDQPVKLTFRLCRRFGSPHER